ncbi:TetR/AcrR family transcriptional regulator [Baekduia soli]|uniref:TetR/AcrR family transcriptional regulator n=1 Tax=Baekduia soli TaxID=496014 RepID=A0A5B8U0G3_9ACTN|nr:TetR/AcrR family transcriptional regulator [Baekduia soli]QEC46486.1 TetR/AcrR family transcriptional regulator [Baekduia soli]
MDECTALRQEARREVVREAALRVFSRQGYRGTSMQDLAREAGMGKASLYHYFNSKQEVLTELYEEVLRENVRSALRIADADRSPVQALTDVVVDRVAYTCENRRLLNVFFEEEAELPTRMRARLIRVRREYDDAILAIVERGIARGEIVLATTPRVFVNTVLGAANWVYKWYDPRGPMSPEELGRDMAGVLLGGVVPAPVPSPPSPASRGRSPS